MGVMDCQRSGSENMGSEYLFYGITHVCESCIFEFLQELENANKIICTKKYFNKKFKKFLKSKKNEFRLKHTSQQPFNARDFIISNSLTYVLKF
jgi:hypothetical protein